MSVLPFINGRQLVLGILIGNHGKVLLHINGEQDGPHVEQVRAESRSAQTLGAHTMLGTVILFYRLTLFQPLHTCTRTNLRVTYSGQTRG